MHIQTYNKLFHERHGARLSAKFGIPSNLHTEANKCPMVALSVNESFVFFDSFLKNTCQNYINTKILNHLIKKDIMKRNGILSTTYPSRMDPQERPFLILSSYDYIHVDIQCVYTSIYKFRNCTHETSTFCFDELELCSSYITPISSLHSLTMIISLFEGIYMITFMNIKNMFSSLFLILSTDTVSLESSLSYENIPASILPSFPLAVSLPLFLQTLGSTFYISKVIIFTVYFQSIINMAEH